MRRASFVLVALLLAGCAAPAEPPAPGPDVAEADAESFAEPVRVSFRAVTRTAGPVDVAGLAWWPAGEPSSVILAVHGSGGVKENNWGPLPTPGYALGEIEAANGRGLVGIDLPGYGETEGDERLIGMEDYAFVVDQVADALRSGTYGSEGADAVAAPIVLGLGHSMGGLVVELAQGTFASFDGVVAAGYVHGPYNEETQACFNGGDCPDVREICFWQETADPEVVEAVIAPMVQPPLMAGMSIFAWSEPNTAPAQEERVAARIEVPVLVLVGTKDWFFDAEGFDREEDVFTGTDDATVVVFDDIGHFVFHHRNHADVVGATDAWLTERGW
ncbi:MAG TPA: alpha/beta fold hydrolase [Candidatus Thermoplasmatota archaeon]|nr:alpha/beta fold hydrolase [Candidatus Thermoplasmatota archaeon]